jgi:hypothetical protein
LKLWNAMVQSRTPFAPNLRDDIFEESPATNSSRK